MSSSTAAESSPRADVSRTCPTCGAATTRVEELVACPECAWLRS